MHVSSYVDALHLVPKSHGSTERNANKSDSASDGLSKGRCGAFIGNETYSISVCLVCLGFIYSVHNLIAPNMSIMAKETFQFTDAQRDEYLGGELTFLFYAPGIVVAIFFGFLAGVTSRKILFGVVIALTALPTLATTWVETFSQLAWTRAITGIGIGGALPVVYSMVGDWFAASQRSAASAYVTAACGGGVLGGQLFAAVVGRYDWRWSFLFIAIAMLIMGVVFIFTAQEPPRGQQEEGLSELVRGNEFEYQPKPSFRHIASVIGNKTNMLVLIQAFPGNIPWGILLTYLHDFLMEDIKLSSSEAMFVVTWLASAGFVGVLIGGFIGQYTYNRDPKYLALYCGVVSILRVIPVFIIFGWPYFFPHEKNLTGFLVVLSFAGVLSTMAAPGLGAMLLNVNLPDTRGTICAIYSVLDDVSKGVGALVVALVVPIVGGRAVAYQLCLLVWIIAGVALLDTCNTFSRDEEGMKKRLEEIAGESIIKATKRKAQSQIGKLSREAALAIRYPTDGTGGGAVHFRGSAPGTDSDEGHERSAPGTTGDRPHSGPGAKLPYGSLD